MANRRFEYNQMVEAALKGVMRDVLRVVAAEGLPKEHHFYITFRTGEDAVQLPPHLADKYQDEMTIVLQHRYWGLEVFDDHFKVGLSFNQKPELLTIPFDLVTSFVDPASQFALQFDLDGGEAGAFHLAEPSADETGAKAGPAPAADAESDTPPERENVVTLDSFRKKR